MSDPLDDLLDSLGSILEMSNKMLGYPKCAAPCKHGGTCSLDTGHNGSHISKGFDEELCRWEAEWVR